VLGYALRRTANTADASDVAAETMTIAWRRLDDVPEGDEARWWLYAVARRVLANRQRGERRQDRLVAKLAAALDDTFSPAYDDGSAAAVLSAIARLDAADRELLQLVAWEGLSPGEAALVLNINPTTARTRPPAYLHRRRHRRRSVDRRPARRDEPQRRIGVRRRSRTGGRGK
jgi:RNA polymerase sigma-70 factor (ECF subfamily)